MPKSHPDAEIAFIEPADEEATIPEQSEFYQLPVRFGAVPVDEAPLGWEEGYIPGRHRMVTTAFTAAEQ